MTPKKKDEAVGADAGEQPVSLQAQFSEYRVVEVEKTSGPPLGVQVEQTLGAPRED